ncbi:40S ribosomal protein S30 [Gregarina niphandrodes]|uniref:40S ribosomal protein S30 n=1 Tax=Gregarina niphandrodes TaxID=110365 RepID=A0A023B3V2_GRENI|nr:40S ribosomal protein S30 [Gregarina niphandrodes]EZG55537.1 40S ribosomal protein S30 [Gregarina niphandrodes]|eukprot:XP_011131523.1 40S ribosomal protein S30 [Gregarina niphandrodes]
MRLGSGPSHLQLKCCAPVGKVHGSLARAGKVKSQTPRVSKQDKEKPLTGRAKKRMQYNKRFMTLAKKQMGPKRGPNSQAHA